MAAEIDHRQDLPSLAPELLSSLVTMKTPRWIRSLCPAALALAALVTAGCALRPQPEPPADARLDTGKLFADPSEQAGLQEAPGLIHGTAGAVDPPGAVVRVYNLDRADDPVDAVVREDGSFDVELEIVQGEEVRLQVHHGSVRSTPVDLVIGDRGQTPALSVRPLSACLLLTPALEAELGDPDPAAALETTVSVTNRCDHAVSFEEPRLRRPAAGLDLPGLADWPATLGPGAQTTLRVRYQGEGVEEILFVEASAPVRDRRPVTLRAGAVP